MNQPKLTSRVKDAFKGNQELKNEQGEDLIGFDFEIITEKVVFAFKFFNLKIATLSNPKTKLPIKSKYKSVITMLIKTIINCRFLVD